MKKRLSFITVLIMSVVIVSTATAATFLKDKRTPNIPSGRIIRDDLYLRGRTVTFNGQVDGDLVALGQTINVNGDVNGNLIAIGAVVNISGTVAQDLYAIAGKLNINGNINDDARVMSFKTNLNGTVQGDAVSGSRRFLLNNNAEIGRDLLLTGSSMKLNGRIGRDLRVSGGSVVVSDGIDRNLWADVNSLNLTSNARVGGDLNYKSARAANIETGATVAGETDRKSRNSKIFRILIFRILFFIGLIVFGFVLIFLFPNTMTLPAKASGKDLLLYLVLGIILLFVIPLVSLLIAMTVIGIPLAAFILALYLAIVYMSPVIWSIHFGGRALRPFIKNKKISIHLSMIAGLIILALISLVSFIPVAGTFLLILIIILVAGSGLGGILVNIKRAYPKIEEAISSLSGEHTHGLIYKSTSEK